MSSLSALSGPTAMRELDALRARAAAANTDHGKQGHTPVSEYGFPMRPRAPPVRHAARNGDNVSRTAAAIERGYVRGYG